MLNNLTLGVAGLCNGPRGARVLRPRPSSLRGPEVARDLDVAEPRLVPRKAVRVRAGRVVAQAQRGAAQERDLQQVRVRVAAPGGTGLPRVGGETRPSAGLHPGQRGHLERLVRRR